MLVTKSRVFLFFPEWPQLKAHCSGDPEIRVVCVGPAAETARFSVTDCDPCRLSALAFVGEQHAAPAATMNLTQLTCVQRGQSFRPAFSCHIPQKSHQGVVIRGQWKPRMQNKNPWFILTGGVPFWEAWKHPYSWKRF